MAGSKLEGGRSCVARCRILEGQRQARNRMNGRSATVYPRKVMEKRIPAEILNQQKEQAARAALRYVRSGMVVGLGSGSTAARFIALLGERVARGELRILAVASSVRCGERAKSAGIPLREPSRGLAIDLAVDGADEIAPDLGLIKGAGGALLREKVLARASRRFLVIADASKLVPKLGRRPVPIEVVPFAAPWVADAIAKIGAEPVLRIAADGSGKPFLTDQGNHILDCRFRDLERPEEVAAQLDRIPGLVDHGLFLGYAHAALVAGDAGVIAMRPGKIPAPPDDDLLS